MISIQKTEKQKQRDRLENVLPEQVEELQEELELEKEKKELISSLYDDWIYEYNIREHTFDTISGSGARYRFKEGRKGDKTFVILDGLHPEDEKKLIESCGEIDHLKPVHLEARILCEGIYRWVSMTTKVLYGKEGRPV